MPFCHFTRGTLLKHGGIVFLNAPCQKSLSRTPPNICTDGMLPLMGFIQPGLGSKNGAASTKGLPCVYENPLAGPSPYMSTIAAAIAFAPPVLSRLQKSCNERCSLPG